MSVGVPDRRAAKEGETFMWEGKPYSVKPKAEGTNGQWICISCEVALDNQLQKDTHCGGKRKKGSNNRPGGLKGSGPRARHVLAWRSLDTGDIEVP